ncbi:MAG TPA: SsrA-binding protein [Bacteroidales bacterium]|nr:SsrA-binding protein [Bacteroidales bacterium]
MSLPKINIKNKRASFEYFLIERFVAGIQLQGTEIKSIRYGKANLSDSYCVFIDHELFVRNLHISEYALGTHYNHVVKRDRKLLLSKKELRKLKIKLDEKGFTIIPTSLFINDRGLAKIEIALAKGKHTYDKRETIKQKDIQRDIDREH